MDTSVPVENTLEWDLPNKKHDEKSAFADMTSIGDFEESVVELETPQPLSPDKKYDIH